MNKFYLYSLEDPRTNKPFYIGKGQGKRALAHFWTNEKEVHPFVYNKIQKMKREGVKPDVFILRDGLTEQKALAYEQIMIAIYGRRNIGLGPLVNLTDGGEGTSGYKHTQEGKAKIGRGNKDKKHPMSEQQKHDISVTMTGMIRGPLTEQHRYNLSESRKKPWTQARRKAYELKYKPELQVL